MSANVDKFLVSTKKKTALYIYYIYITAVNQPGLYISPSVTELSVHHYFNEFCDHVMYDCLTWIIRACLPLPVRANITGGSSRRAEGFVYIANSAAAVEVIGTRSHGREKKTAKQGECRQPLRRLLLLPLSKDTPEPQLGTAASRAFKRKGISR